MSEEKIPDQTSNIERKREMIEHTLMYMLLPEAADTKAQWEQQYKKQFDTILETKEMQERLKTEGLRELVEDIAELLRTNI